MYPCKINHVDPHVPQSVPRGGVRGCFKFVCIGLLPTVLLAFKSDTLLQSESRRRPKRQWGLLPRYVKRQVSALMKENPALGLQ